MSSRGARRAPAAVRTRALCVVLLLLLQHACRLPCPAAARPVMTVRIKRYLTFPNDVFDVFPEPRVAQPNSAIVCNAQSAFMAADQTDAAHNAITRSLRTNIGPSGTAFAYLGGDFSYSMNDPDEKKQCRRGAEYASTNCIYRWNLGGFLTTGDPAFAGGVPFFAGSLYNVSGAGPLNGFTPRWADKYPGLGETYVLGVVAPQITTGSVWYDGLPFADSSIYTVSSRYIVICEIQGPTETETLTLSMTTTVSASETLSSTLSATASLTWSLFSPPVSSSETDLAQGADSWARQYWWVILLIVLLILIIALFIVLVFCCLRRRKRKALFASEWEPPIERESDQLDSNEKVVLKKQGFMGHDWAVGMEAWSPFERDAVHVDERAVPAEMDSVELVTFAPPAVAVPSELSAQTGQRRRSTVRSTRQRSRGKSRVSTNVFSDVDIPEGEEIVDLEIINI